MLSALKQWEAQCEAAFKALLSDYLKKEPLVIKALESTKEHFREQYFFNNGIKAIMTSCRKSLEEKDKEIRELKLKIQELENANHS
jgi:hypothetical protein